MSEKNLRQSDIIEKAKIYSRMFNDDVRITKSDLSQYVSGKVEPRQDKLTLLSLALDVSTAWLMGFDSPKHNNIEFIADESDETSRELLKMYNVMNDAQKRLLVRIAKAILEEDAL